MSNKAVPYTIDGRNVIFKCHTLTRFFTCPLCHGHFREAHTIRECLHTFCKSCLFRHLLSSKACPSCGTDLGAHPHKLLTYDRSVQQLQDKLFPHAKELDEKLEREFYLQRGIRFHPATGEPLENTETVKAKEERERPTKRIKTEERRESEKEGKERETAQSEGKEKVQSSVSFRCIPVVCDDSLPPLPRNFVITSAEAGIKHVKQFIIQQLAEKIEEEQLEILLGDVVLGGEHSIEYIMRTHGIVYKMDDPVVFQYRRRSKAFLF